MNWKFVILGAAALIALIAPAVADEARYVIVDYRWQGEFRPDQAYFLVDFDRPRPRRVAAQMIQTRDDDEGQEWSFGTVLRVASSKRQLSYVMVVKGANNRFILSEPQRVQTAEQALGGSAEELRGRLEKQKELYQDWQEQVKKQSSSLDRLRTDADVIGDLGRIAEIGEQIERIQEHVASVDGDIAALRRFMKLAGSDQPPINFERRMNTLNKQLTDLAQAVRLVESGERVRRSRSEADLRRQLKLVEDTRGENYDTLRRELEQLRTRRKRLDAKVDEQQGYSDPAPDEYEVPAG